MYIVLKIISIQVKKGYVLINYILDVAYIKETNDLYTDIMQFYIDRFT